MPEFTSQSVCKPVYVYLIFAAIMALVGICIVGYQRGGVGVGASISTFLSTMCWALICAFILWLICNYVKDPYGNYVAWAIVIIIILSNLSGLISYFRR